MPDPLTAYCWTGTGAHSLPSPSPGFSHARSRLQSGTGAQGQSSALISSAGQPFDTYGLVGDAAAGTRARQGGSQVV